MKKITLLILLLVSSIICAQDPIVSYQGQLTTNGTPVNATVDFVIRFYATENGTTAQLSSSFSSTTVVDGLFTLPISSTNPQVIEGLFQNFPEIWLELSVNGEVQLPRQKVSKVPYAIDSAALDGRLAADYALTTDIPWSDGFGGTQYIGDVIIGDLVASAGDTLQVVSQVDESPLRLLVGGVGTRFRVSKNGGTGIGANYSDGQIPDNGLRVAGNVQLEGASDASSAYSLSVSSPTGTHPLAASVNGILALQVADNGGVRIGNGFVNAFPPPASGLVVGGETELSSKTTINDELIVKRDAKHSRTDSYGFVKAGIEFSCGNIGTARLNYFNNINADEITVRDGALFGTCVVELPFSYEDLYFQTQIEESGGKIIAGSCKKSITGGTTEVVVCSLYDVVDDTYIIVANRVTLLMF
ncbi:MAG: hypothetical protein L3J83_12005 [Proteobacteria bacterium]|nr:hypothetical protein [Pseudomonadota bacterium]